MEITELDAKYVILMTENVSWWFKKKNSYLPLFYFLLKMAMVFQGNYQEIKNAKECNS